MLAARHGATGDQVKLVVPGLAGGLNAAIVGSTTNATRLQFDIQPEMSSLLLQFLEAMVDRGEQGRSLKVQKEKVISDGCKPVFFAAVGLCPSYRESLGQKPFAACFAAARV